MAQGVQEFSGEQTSCKT